MITRQTMRNIAIEAALRNNQFTLILNKIEQCAKSGEFYMIAGIGRDLIERLRAEPYMFDVEVDDRNVSEPAVIRWN